MSKMEILLKLWFSSKVLFLEKDGVRLRAVEAHNLLVEYAARRRSGDDVGDGRGGTTMDEKAKALGEEE